MKRLGLTISLLFLLLTGCSDDPVGNSIDCSEDQLYDHIHDTCVDRLRPADNQGANDDDPDVIDDEDTNSDGDTDDVEDDVYDPFEDIDCDEDGDGDLKYICGGLDCDDNDPNRSSLHVEVCDHIDNNCDGIVNGGIECSFYAHTNDSLYAIDPFALTANKESDLVDRHGDRVRILDIDTHPSGTLYGITRREVYVFYDAENYWIRVAGLSDLGDANGLAIDSHGIAYVTVEGHFFTIDLAEIEDELARNGYENGHFNFYYSPPKIMTGGGYFYSSGDAVINKQDTFYMSSKHDDEEDYLVEIDRETGDAFEIGAIGYDRVFGLTAGWGQLYGITSSGELIEIDRFSAEGTLLKYFPNKIWYGAASTPKR